MLWLDESQIDPGVYYVMLRTTDFDCIGNPSCLDGYSNILTLTVPKPSHTYRGSVEALHYTHIAFLSLRVTRLGESLPYKVCWLLKNKRRRCVTGRVDGYSLLGFLCRGFRERGLRGMKLRTTFSWYVHGRKVASKTANTTRR